MQVCRFYFILSLLFALSAYADPRDEDVADQTFVYERVGPSGRLQLEPHMILRGSNHVGGQQPSYDIDIDHPVFTSIRERARSIGEINIPFADKVAQLVELIQGFIPNWHYLGNNERSLCYQTLVDDFKPADRKNFNIPLSRYPKRCQSGVCREYAIIFHFLLRDAGIQNDYAYARVLIQHKGAAREPSGEHAFNIARDEAGREWVLDAYDNGIHGFPLETLMQGIAGDNFEGQPHIRLAGAAYGARDARKKPHHTDYRKIEQFMDFIDYWRVDQVKLAAKRQAAAAQFPVTPTYRLTEQERIRAFNALNVYKKQYTSLTDAALLKELETVLDAPSYQALVAAQAHPGLITHDDLVQLCAYIQFIKQRGIPVSNMPLTIRIEEAAKVDQSQLIMPLTPKAYVLLPAAYTLIQTFNDEDFLWAQSEKWGKERFVDNQTGRYLLGQFPGKSKFVAVGSFYDTPTRAQLLTMLGLESSISQVGDTRAAYVVRVEPSVRNMGNLKPLIPIIYKERRSENAPFTTVAGFGQNTIPGFSSGGIAEAVIETFTYQARNLTELSGLGVQVLAVPAG